MGLVSNTEDWLTALEEELSKQYPEGVVGKGLNFVFYNGCQPTSTRFKSCNTLGIKQTLKAIIISRGMLKQKEVSKF